MSASSSVASSTLSRGRAAVFTFATVATVAAAYGVYHVYASSVEEAETENNLPAANGLHRRNAIHRRRRREASTTDIPSSPLVDGRVENGGEEPLTARTLTDGETVVDDADYGYGSWSASEDPQRNGQNIVQLLFRVSEDATRRNAYVHRGCACNSCGSVPIRGIRYRCSNCADFDLCEGCEAQGVHTKTHIFYKIKVPGPWFGPRSIQPVWYAGDPDSMRRILPKEINTKLTLETGFERPDLDAYWEQWTFMANTDWRDDPLEINLAMDRKTFERCLVPSGGYRHTSPSLIFDRMFAFYDTNKDDLIGFSEFLHGLSYRKKKDKWNKIFEGYDIDEDGYVDRKDFLRMFRSYYVLYRQMHRDVLESMEEQQMSCTEAHRLVTSRQPLSSAFGQDGRYPRAPDLRTGEGKTIQANGDVDIHDGKGIINESGNDTGNREDIFRQNMLALNRLYRGQNMIESHPRGGYWETIMEPPERAEDFASVVRDMRALREHSRRLREQAHDILQGHANPNAHPALSLPPLIPTDDQESGESPADSEEEVPHELPDISWLPNYVTVTQEDVEAIDGLGRRITDVRRNNRRAVIQHAVYRERAQREIYERWKRRQFYTDEEEGANPPADWKEDDDVLAHAAVNGESSKTPSRPPVHSRSSSKVRFAEDMDDFDTRSNPSTSSRSVPERWGGMEIPDAERDAGKEILYQVTQQAFNELLDPFFKEKEDLAIQAAETKAKRERHRVLFSDPEFTKWALEKEAKEKEEGDAKHEKSSDPRQVWPAEPPRSQTSNMRQAWPDFPQVELEEVRQMPLRNLMAATGYHVDPEALENQDIDQIPDMETIPELESQVPTNPNRFSTGDIYQDPDTQEASGSNNPPLEHSSQRRPISPMEVLSIIAQYDDDRSNGISPQSSTQNTPPYSRPDSLSSSPSYRDPTFPQFRPNSSTSPSINGSLDNERRHTILNPPEISRVDNIAALDDTSETHHQALNSDSLPLDLDSGIEEAPRKDSDTAPPSQEMLYHLWKCDRAATEAEERGGWGRLCFKEFDGTVKRLSKEGKANQMEYLGSWIDFCMP